MDRCLARAIAVSVALTLVVAAPASALTRKQASKIALAALKPSTEKGPSVVVFALPSRLRAGDTVAEAGTPDGKSSVTIHPRPQGRKAWLFWEDLQYGAKFTHPSRVLVVDDQTGHVKRSSMQWWPLVDGKAPPFIRNRGHDAKYRVYSSPNVAVAGATRPARAAKKFGPDGLKGECVITLVDLEGYYRDGVAFGKWWHDRGATVYGNAEVADATGLSKPHPNGQGSKDLVVEDPDGAALLKFVKQITANCPDIIIYLSGHGKNDAVAVGDKYHYATGPKGHPPDLEKATADVTVSDLQALVRIVKTSTFKIVIDACHAGHYADKLKGEKNVAVVLTATGDGLLETTVGFPGGVSAFTESLLQKMDQFEDEGADDTSGADKGARVIERAGAQLLNLSFDFMHSLGALGAHVQEESNLPAPVYPSEQPAPTTPTAPSCAGSGQSCAQDGAVCSGGASCGGNGATCHDPGTTCGPGSGDKCDSGAQCSGPGATCDGAGTQCTQTGDTCTNGATCVSSMSCTGQADPVDAPANTQWSFDVKCDKPFAWVRITGPAGNTATNYFCQSGWNGQISGNVVTFTHAGGTVPENTSVPFGVFWTNGVPDKSGITVEASQNADGSNRVTVTLQ